MCCKFKRRGESVDDEPVVCIACRQQIECWLLCYNYGENAEEGFNRILEVECRIQALLLQGDDEPLLDSYVKIIKWANLSRPVHHVQNAQLARQSNRNAVLENLRVALLPDTSSSEAFKALLRIPEVGFASATKFLMFGDPTRYPVMDSKIARWIDPSLFDWQGECLSSTEMNRNAYDSWRNLTSEVAMALNEAGSQPEYARSAGMPVPAQWRPADVERAVFAQFDRGRRRTGECT